MATIGNPRYRSFLWSQTRAAEYAQTRLGTLEEPLAPPPVPVHTEPEPDAASRQPAVVEPLHLHVNRRAGVSVPGGLLNVRPA